MGKGILLVALLLLAAPVVVAQTYCTDSDGLNYFNKGKVTGLELGIPYSHEDVCRYGYTAVEYYCEGNTVKVEKQFCYGGCQNGACVQIGTTRYSRSYVPITTTKTPTPFPVVERVVLEVPMPTPKCADFIDMDQCLDVSSCYWDQETDACYDYRQPCSNPDEENDKFEQAHTFGFRMFYADDRDRRIRTGGLDTCLDAETLREHYCMDTYHMETTEILCVNGCSNGACISGDLICTDTDNGKNYYEAGETSQLRNGNIIGGGEDRCKIGATPVTSCAGDNPNCKLEEYYCDASNLHMSEIIDCSNGCLEGACYYPGFFMETDKPSYSSGETISLTLIAADGGAANVDLYILNVNADIQTKIVDSIPVDGSFTVLIDTNDYPSIFDVSGDYLLLICDAGAACMGGLNANSIVVNVDVIVEAVPPPLVAPPAIESYEQLIEQNIGFLTYLTSDYANRCRFFTDLSGTCDSYRAYYSDSYEAVVEEKHDPFTNQQFIDAIEEEASRYVDVVFEQDFAEGNNVYTVWLAGSNEVFGVIWYSGENVVAALADPEESSTYGYVEDLFEAYVMKYPSDLYFDEPSIMQPVKACLDGCNFRETCIPIGVRAEVQYCDIDGGMKKQKGAKLQCENSFECQSNFCLDARCTTKGFWQKIIGLLGKLI